MAQKKREGKTSSVLTVVGMACLWAWGYTACLSPALMPSTNAIASVGIEYAYYVSQLTLLVLAFVIPITIKRWHPAVSPALVGAASVVLCCTSLCVRWLSCQEAQSDGVDAVFVVCGLLYGLSGLALSVVWCARITLEGERARAETLASFLVGYALYFLSFAVPHAVAAAITPVLPLVSGGLWLYDSWRRHAITAQVWPSAKEQFKGEASEGSTVSSILPWGTLALCAAAALMSNFVSSFVMGSSYSDAAGIFPWAFAVSALLVVVAMYAVRPGTGPLSIERLYRFVLPLCALGMLIILALGTSMQAVGTAVTTGSGLFLQVLVILVVVQSTQLTGISPLLSIAVGQGLIGGVVAVGNIAGRVTSDALAGVAAPLGTTWLAIACAVGVFVLFYLLAIASDNMARELDILRIAQAAEPGAADGGRASSTEPPAEEDFDERVHQLAGCFGLTPRETDVFALLVRGHSLASIGERLFVTAGTVKTHVLHIYRKAGVNSRQELIDLFERRERQAS